MTQAHTDFLEWHSARLLRKRGRPLAAATARNMRQRIQRIAQAAGVDPGPELARMLADPDECERIFDTLAETNTPGSLRLVYEVCVVYAAWAQAQGWSNGTVATERPARNPRQALDIYTSTEVDTLVRAAEGRSVHLWVLLCMLVHSGRRIGELMRLRWDWLNLDAEVPHFELPWTKNGKPAYLPLDSFLVEHVFTPEVIGRMHTEGRFRTFDRTELLFPWSTYSQAKKHLQRHCARTGVRYRGFHRFRHTKATEMLARGVPPQAVAALLGHADVRTTMSIYDQTTALTYADYLEPTGQAVAERPATPAVAVRGGRRTSTGTGAGGSHRPRVSRGHRGHLPQQEI